MTADTKVGAYTKERTAKKLTNAELRSIKALLDSGKIEEYNHGVTCNMDGFTMHIAAPFTEDSWRFVLAVNKKGVLMSKVLSLSREYGYTFSLRLV